MFGAAIVANMFVLVTDFGETGPYLGQMEAVLHSRAPGYPVIRLLADAPAFDPKPTAYLLPALVAHFPKDSVFVCVVDPGVGSDRGVLILEADEKWFVGPDNGLFEILIRRSQRYRLWDVEWRPPKMSKSFHGRDVFAPIAARIKLEKKIRGQEVSSPRACFPEWPDDLAEVIYIDRYGNAMTGLRAERVDQSAVFLVGGKEIRYAETFSKAKPGEAFWYENANGLVEIAVNRGSATKALGLFIGKRIKQA